MIQRSTLIAWCIFIAALVNLGLLARSGFNSSFTPLLIGSLVFSTLILIGSLVVAQRYSRVQRMATRNKADLALAQDRIGEQSRAIDSFADGMELGIFICDLSATVTYSNRAAREMFSFENPLNRSIMAITLSYDLEQLVIRASKTDVPQAQEILFAGPHERIAMVKAWFSRNADQTFVSILDITNLRRLERVRQDFVANVSHELRTPMTIIRAYAETLLDEAEPESENLHNYLPKMIAEVDRLSGLTRDLLILSQAELEKVQKQRCEFASICASVVYQLVQKAHEKGLGLTYEGPDELWIEANSAQMTQVVINLVDNALNYTVKGRVRVSVGAEEGWAHLKVKDTGIGIASEHVSRIFERFYRVDKGRSRSTGGTGLGLSIVKHIVEAHNGSLNISSILQEGTEFTVSLPIGSVENIPPPTPEGYVEEDASFGLE